MSVTISRSTGHRLDNLPFVLFAAGGSSLGNTCRNSYKRKERRPSLCFPPCFNRIRSWDMFVFWD